jgi:hypothetical protein
MKSITGTYKNKDNWTFTVTYHRLGKSYSISVKDADGTYKGTKGIRESLNRTYIEKFTSGMEKVEK